VGQANHPNIFLTWEWIDTWWDFFGKHGEPWIITARETKEDQLVAVAPFLVRTSGLPKPPYRELSFFGSNVVAPDHLDVVVKMGYEQAVNALFTNYLESHVSNWDVVRLDGIASRSSLINLFINGAATRSSILWETVCPYISLPKTWEEYLSTLDRKLRYNIRSRARRLEQEASASVTYQRVSADDEIPDAMTDLFRLHSQARIARSSKSHFIDPQAMAFHRRLAEVFHRKGWLRLYILKLDQEAIAAIYCIRYRDTVYFYQTGHDPSWGRFGPGTAIIAHGIRASIEEGAGEFDFLRGAEAYKLRWTKQARKNLSGLVAVSAKGQALVGAYRVRRAALHAFNR